MLIPAYQNSNNCTEDYKKRSVICKNIANVRNYLMLFRKHVTDKRTLELLDTLFNNLELLKKTQIVNDNSYKNCTVVIKPFTSKVDVADKYLNNSEKNYFYSADNIERLNFISKYAETCFVFLDLLYVNE